MSVVIAYYKAAEWLPMQLHALAQQTEPPSFEVIIADNEGSAELPSVIEPFHDALDVRIVDATRRRGCGAARNQGVDKARGNFILFCDADDVVSPGWVIALTDALRARDVLSTGPLRLDRINCDHVWRTTIGARSNQHTDRPVLQEPFTYLGYLPFAYGCNIGLRRSTFLTLSGFDETFTRGDDDVDLSWRALENGVEIAVARGGLVDYRLRPTAVGVWRQRLNYQRSQVDMWARSRQLGRPVSGMSLRWTLAETIKLIPQSLHAARRGISERYAFAAHAGDILGNLQGQWDQRITKRITPQHESRQELMPPLTDDHAGQDSEVSVIIPFYQDESTLPMQLDALATQIGPPPFDVIIADNDGSVDLRAILDPYRDRLSISAIDATARRGAAHARNVGAERARGKLLAFCDADDIVSTRWLSAMTSPLFEEDVHTTGPSRMDRLNLPYQWRIFTGDSRGNEEAPVLHFPFPLLGYLPFASSNNLAIRRSQFLKLGGFNESLDKGLEDVDLSWRASEHSVPLRVIDDAVVDYRLRGSSRAVYKQRRDMARGEVAIWTISRREHRPVRGMSLRWTLVETTKLIPQGLRAMNSGKTGRYSFSGHAGDVLGNLQGQLEQRVLPRLRSRIHGGRLGTAGSGR